MFAGIIPLARCDSNSFLQEIKKFYTANGIDIRKMVIFTSDSAAVMLGKRNGVAKLLQNFTPHITEEQCVAHREDLGIDDAWSKVSLMQDMCLSAIVNVLGTYEKGSGLDCTDYANSIKGKNWKIGNN